MNTPSILRLSNNFGLYKATDDLFEFIRCRMFNISINALDTYHTGRSCLMGLTEDNIYVDFNPIKVGNITPRYAFFR